MSKITIHIKKSPGITWCGLKSQPINKKSPICFDGRFETNCWKCADAHDPKYIVLIK